jgi:hypothetical protein
MRLKLHHIPTAEFTLDAAVPSSEKVEALLFIWLACDWLEIRHAQTGQSGSQRLAAEREVNSHNKPRSIPFGEREMEAFAYHVLGCLRIASTVFFGVL